MDRDNFIIAVFLLVCEQYAVIKQQYRLRQGGFQPSLTDEEVITMEICGEYFKIECDKDAFRLFKFSLPALFSKTQGQVFACPSGGELMACQTSHSKTPDSNQR